MEITNNRKLPEAFVRAVTNDPYSSGGSDFTATSLANPPRQRVLIKQNFAKIKVEAFSRFAAVLGQGAHKLLERAARPGIDIIETRYFVVVEVDGKLYKVSAQIDMLDTDTATLYDWKTTKAWAFSKKGGSGKKAEWTAQLNIAKFIMSRQTPAIPVMALSIIGLLRDWDEKVAARDPGYPQNPVLEAPQALWSDDTALEHIQTRIRLHAAAESLLPLCTSAETWGGSRCKSWCDAAQVCSQYQEGLRSGLMFKEVNA